MGDVARGRGPGGRIAVCGATTGPEPAGGAAPDLVEAALDPRLDDGDRSEDFAGAYELVASGRALPVVDSVLPLEEIRAAHERLEAGEQLGKIVLTI